MEFPLVDELSIISLFILIWTFEYVCAYFIRTSPLVGQILAGIILGPALLDIIPFSDAFRLLGKVGVLMLVLDSGLKVNLDQVKKSGCRAVAAGVIGVICPVVLTMLVVIVLYGENWKVALAAGAALAPTSLGFSVELLSEVNELHTPEGQLICTAAVVDDVISLLLLAEVQALQGDNIGYWDIFQPIVASVGSVVIGSLLTLLSIEYLPELGKIVPKKHHSTIFTILVLCYAALFSWLSALVGSSDLIGCYFAGVAFSKERELVIHWEKNTHQIVRWSSALFFAATIGFGIPSFTESGGLFETDAILRGLPLIAVAVIGKLAVGALSKPLTYLSFMKFGFAMGGRGEFSFLIADEAFASGLFSRLNYSAVIWALLVSSLSAPFGFRYYMQKQRKQANSNNSPDAIIESPVSTPRAQYSNAESELVRM